MILHRLISSKFPCVSLLVLGVWLTLSTHGAQCAVTEVYVAKGHTLHDVEQLLSKKTKSKAIIRVAKSHHIIGVCSSAKADDPDETAATGSLEVGDVAAIGDGRYRFDLNAQYMAKAGTYIVQFRDHSLRGNPVLNPTLTVRIREVVVTDISFFEGEPHGLGIRLPGVSYDFVIAADEWENGKRNYPGAWVRGGTKKIRVKLYGPPNNTVSISADGTWGGIDANTVTFDDNGVATKLMQIGSFPTTVVNGNVGWQWKSTRQGITTNINTTAHNIFVVLREPTTYTRYKQLYELGCGWAQGEDTEDGVMNKIWGGFKTKNIVVDGQTMRYWKATLPRAFDQKVNLLLIDKDGRCSAWEPLFRMLCGIQGITFEDFNLEPIPVATRQDTDQYVIGFFRVTSEAQGENGTPEGKPSRTDFLNHMIGLKSPRETRDNQEYYDLYDPSYASNRFSGNSQNSALNSWETNSVHLFMEKDKSTNGETGEIMQNSSERQTRRIVPPN